jgi:hypothetical protein
MRWMVMLLALWAGAAVAQGGREAPIAAFYGRWVGSGLSESGLSSTFRLTQRDFDVEVQPDGDGFRLTWTTVQRQKGDPLNPFIVRRERTVNFKPAGQPNVWRSAENTDPLTGQPYVWARMEKQTLVVTVLDMEPDGRWEMQIYRRTLSDLGMKLDFTRMADGEPQRTAQGRLTKYSR